MYVCIHIYIERERERIMPVYSIHMPIQSLPLQPLVLGFTYGVTSRTEVANRLFVWVAFELRVLNHTHTHPESYGNYSPICWFAVSPNPTPKTSEG